MAENKRTESLPPEHPSVAVANDLVALMPRDVVFVPRFLGESQERLRQYFREFSLAEMARAGITSEQHPMLSVFLDRHAALLCEFVFVGVSLPHQLRMEDVERLQHDDAGLLRMDLWDQLKIHIAAAEERFRVDLPMLAESLARLEPSREGRNKEMEP